MAGGERVNALYGAKATSNIIGLIFGELMWGLKRVLKSLLLPTRTLPIVGSLFS